MTNPHRALTVNDLPLAELHSARLDGQLFELADSWHMVDEIDGCASRAVAASRLVPPRAIAEQLTAAWIYGAASEPGRHQFCVLIGARTTALWSPRARVREVVRTPDNIRTINGVRLTTQLRTAVDLARYLPETAPVLDVTALLARLLHHGGYSDIDAAVRLYTRSHAAYSAVAAARFAPVSSALSDLSTRAQSNHLARSAV